ncbi:MAG: hypothetical protein HZA53_01575 [Planctomycetes bacterium]|nr:hypothetical protein [Planctomycetota bacterium]
MSKQRDAREPSDPARAAARASSGPNVALRLVIVAVVALTLLALVLKQAF